MQNARAGQVAGHEDLIDVARLVTAYYALRPDPAEPGQRVAFGTPKEEFADADIPDTTGPEWIAWLPLVVLALVIGIFPNIVFRVSDGQMTSVAQALASAVGG